MARRLAFAILITFGVLGSPRDACAENGNDSALQSYRVKVVILGAIAGIELLLVLSLLRGRTASRSAQAALQAKEGALRKSEEMFSKAFRQGPMAVTLTSATTQRYIDVNETYERMTGFSRAEVLGRTVQEIGLWVDPEERTNLTQKLLSEQRLRDIEFRFRRKDGVIRIAQASADLIEVAGEVCALGVVADITDRKEAEEALAESEKDVQAARAEFSGRLIQAQEKERTRIARELHDDINQRLALLANGVEHVIQANGDYTKAEQTGELRRLWRLTNEIATDIQHLSHQLHPSKLHYLGLATAVRDLCQEFSRQHGINAHCNVVRVPSDMDENVSLSLFRTVQEALRNVARHSQASRVNVELIHDAGVVRLRVCDDGVGFDPGRPENSPGLGLASMGERLRSVGGQLRVSSQPGHGTQIEGMAPATLKRNKAAYSAVE